MRFHLLSPLLLCFSSALAGAAEPSAKEAAPVEDPRAPFQRLAGLQGNWECTGQTMDGKGGYEPLTASLQVKPELDGNWYDVRYAEKATPTRPMPTRATLLMGYDVTTKRFPLLMANNFGNAVTFHAKPGKTEVFVFEGTASAHGKANVAQKQTFTLTTPGQLGLSYAFKDRGTWHKLLDLQCKH